MVYLAGSMPADSQTLSVKAGKIGTMDLELKEVRLRKLLLKDSQRFAKIFLKH